MSPGPAKIHKIGHFGYETDNYEKTCEVGCWRRVFFFRHWLTEVPSLPVVHRAFQFQTK